MLSLIYFFQWLAHSHFKSIVSHSLNTCTHLYLMIIIPAGTGFCDEEATQFLLWPETPAGMTRSLPCPNTTTIINRTCNPPGIWDNVDLSLCRTGFCDEEATQFLLWPETPAGITRSLPCPNSTTIIDRTCNPPGIWDNVNLSLCSTGFCDEEATQFLLWPETPAGMTRSLPCPNTTAIINRTCNPPGIWDDDNSSLCIPLNFISTVSISVRVGGGGRILSRGPIDLFQVLQNIADQ